MAYLFVYGTLMKGFSSKESEFLQENSAYVGKGHINGKLYEVDGYPGAILCNTCSSKVWGEIYEIKKVEKVFKVLDRYEEVGGAYPNPNEYKREVIEVVVNGGGHISCVAYLYNHSTAQLKLIPSGDYLNQT